MISRQNIVFNSFAHNSKKKRNRSKDGCQKNYFHGSLSSRKNAFTWKLSWSFRQQFMCTSVHFSHSRSLFFYTGFLYFLRSLSRLLILDGFTGRCTSTCFASLSVNKFRQLFGACLLAVSLCRIPLLLCTKSSLIAQLTIHSLLWALLHFR